jgi:hypothetical protein
MIPFIIVCIGLILGYLSTTGTKSQWIRLLDIFVIGPLMIWVGNIFYSADDMDTKINPRLRQLFSTVLIFFGATTITYNLRNYLATSQK